MMTQRVSKTLKLPILPLALVLIACNATPEPAPEPAPAATFEEAQEILRAAAAAQGEAVRLLTFEEFERTVYKEPWEGGKYIVNGDSPITDRKHLREFYEKIVALGDPGSPEGEPSSLDAALIVHQDGELDAIWNDSAKRALSYCVSAEFADNYDAVVSSMREATGAWEAAADVAFAHDASQDSDCTAENPAIVFDTRPISGARYLARAFFPNETRFARNILIDDSSFDLGGGGLTLTGILRHELGHALGFRHEHTRPDSGTCFEDAAWRPLTDYDPFSVMHYPQCNGLGDWTLELTHEDENGAACLYGAAAGFTIDEEICEPKAGESTPGEPRTESFVDQSVERGASKLYGPFAVTPLTLFTASIGGPAAAGDPDLYVRFGDEPDLERYSCRPYLPGAEEDCSIDVPAQESVALVMVHGYLAGVYDLTVSYTPAP